MKKYAYILPVALLFAAVLYFGAHIPESAARVLLQPYVRLTELFFNNRHVYISGVGYLEENGMYAIGYDCLGINFIGMQFVNCAVPFLPYFRGLGRWLWTFLCFIEAVICGFLVNAIRIIGSVPFAVHPKFGLMHAALGASLYLIVLSASYCLLRKAVPRFTEKVVQPSET